MYQEILKKTPASQHSSDLFPSASSSQRMAHKPPGYAALEYNGDSCSASNPPRGIQAAPKSGTMLHNTTLTKHGYSLNLPKKVSQKPEFGLKPFIETKNVDKTKVMEILPKPKVAVTEPSALNIRSGISPLIYCRQNSVGKSSTYTSHLEKSDSLENKVKSTSIIVSQRNCIVQKRREERQSFEDMLTEVEEKSAQNIVKKKLKRSNSHSIKSDGPSELVNISENANLETSTSSKQEKQSDVHKPGKHQSFKTESVKMKHVKNEHVRTLEHKGKNELDKRTTGKLTAKSSFEVNQKSSYQEHKHDSKLSSGIKAIVDNSDKRIPIIPSEEPSNISLKIPDKVSVKPVLKAPPMDYHNLYLYCIKKSYRLKHVNWNCSSQTLLRMLKKKYKSLKLMFYQESVLCLDKCATNKLYKNQLKGTSDKEQARCSKVPAEKECEIDSTNDDDQHEQGSLVDPRVMSLSKTLVSSDSGKVGLEKFFKKHAPSASGKSSQKSKIQFNKKISKPDWSKLKEKLKAISSKPIKKKHDGFIVEKDLTKMPLQFGNLIFNQVPQFRIPLKSNSKGKEEEEQDLVQDAEPGCDNDSDATICESDEESADNNIADTIGMCNDLSTLSNEVESNLLKSSSEVKYTDENTDGLPYTVKPDDTHDNFTLGELAKSYNPPSEDKIHENIFEIVSCQTLHISDEACDVIPDLYAEEHDMMIINETACDTSPPILERAIDSSPNDENKESTNILELDNETKRLYKNDGKVIVKDSELHKHDPKVDHQEMLQEQAYNTEQRPVCSTLGNTKYSASGDVEVPMEIPDNEDADNEDCLNLVIGNVCSLQSQVADENVLKTVIDSEIDSEKCKDHVSDSKNVTDSQLDTCATFSAKTDCENKISELGSISDKRLVPLVDYMCDSDTSDEDEANKESDTAHRLDVSVESVISITDQKQQVNINQNKSYSEEVATNCNSSSKQHQNCLECIDESYAESENKADANESKDDNQYESEVTNDYVASSSDDEIVDIAVSKNDGSTSISVELSNNVDSECHNNDEDEEDDSVNMDCHEDDKSEINSSVNEENIATEETRSLEATDNLSDDLDDSCSLPDIEPPTVQFIEPENLQNLSTPSDDVHDPSSIIASQTNKVLSGDTKAKGVTKLEALDGKAEKMEFNEERLMCDFPNHNWLFNKYNINTAENSEEQVQRRPKKRKKESLKQEKLDQADDEIETYQRPGRTNCSLDSRLSDCLQGFKCDKSNIETNIKFGWNKKNSKRQLNAFGKGFQNKVNAIKNVFEVEGTDQEEFVSLVDKHKMPQTKSLKLADSDFNLCKTFKSDNLQDTECHDQPSKAINLCTKEEDKLSGLKTDSENDHQIDQSTVFQKLEMPLDLTFDYKVDKNDSVNVEENEFEGTESVIEKSSDDKCSVTVDIAEIRRDVQNILEEMSDNVGKTFERTTEHGQLLSGLDTKHENIVDKRSVDSSDLSIHNDDNDTVVDEDDEESRLEIDESVDDQTVSQDDQSNDVSEEKGTTQSSDSFSSSATISSPASSAISVTTATDISTPETKQDTTQKEEKHTALDISTSKAVQESTEVNFRPPRNKPPVQLVHPQVHKPLSDSDLDHLPSVQEVYSPHNTVFQGTEVQSSRPTQASWTSSDDASTITTKVSSGVQLSITSPLTSVNPNHISSSRAFTSVSLQDGHLSNRRTDSSTALATSVTTYGGGLVIPVQPFVQNVKEETNPNVQNSNVHEHGTPLSIVQQSDSQSFLPNYADKSLNSSTNSGENDVHMLITQSSSLPLQRGLNARPPPLLILPKSQVPPLQASNQAEVDVILPAGANTSMNPLSAPQVPYNSTGKTGTCALAVMNDRQLFISSTNIMNESTSPSTKDIPDDLNQSGNLSETCVEDDVDDEIKKQMEELDAEIKRKEREQEEIRRKKLELLEKMKHAKLANKPKNVTEGNNGSDQKLKLDKCGPEETVVKLETVDSHKGINRKRNHSGHVKGEDIVSSKSIKDVVLTSVSKDAGSCEDVCVKNVTMEVQPSSVPNITHDVSNEELSVTVTDGVISITESRIKEHIIPALSEEDSVLDLALSTNISVSDSGIGLVNETENCVVSANNEVPNNVGATKSVEFIEDIGVVNPFTGEYDETMKMETENEDHLDLSMKSNSNQNLNENKESSKSPLKDAKNKQTSASQETVKEDPPFDGHDSGIKSNSSVKIYSDTSNLDTALNLVKVASQSTISNEGTCSKNVLENKSTISPPTSTESSIYLIPTSYSSMTSSEDPISTSSDIISKSSELSQASHFRSDISPSVLSTNSGITQTSEVTTVSTTSVVSLPQMSYKDSKLTTVESNDLPHPGLDSGVGDKHKLISSEGKNDFVANTCSEEPLNLMCKTSDITEENNPPCVETYSSDVGRLCLNTALSKASEKEQVEDLSVRSHEQYILPSNEYQNESTVTIPVLPLVSEKVPVQELTRTDQVHSVDTISPINSNLVMPSSGKVMYIQDRPVCVQNVNGAMRLTAQINTVPERHSRSRERHRRQKSKLIEIRAAHVKSPPRKIRITKPEPAHVQVNVSKEKIKKMNKVYEIPPSIRQSSPYIPREVPCYLSPHECLKPLSKPCETRAPKPAHMRRPFGIAGHLIVSASRRRKRTFSDEHISSPKFYSLPSTPTTPPCVPPRVSSASQACDIPGSCLDTSRSHKMSSPDKNYDYQGPIRAHCRPRSSINKEHFYETSVLRPPTINKKSDIVADKSDIIDLTSDVTILKDGIERRSVNKSVVTEQAIQDELCHAMSKRQRLDSSEDINNRGQVRIESRTDDSRMDPEIIRKTFVKPPPPYTGRQRMPVLAQFPRRPPFDQPRMANKKLPYNQVYINENQIPGAPRMQFSHRGMDVPRLQNPAQTRAAVNSVAQKQRWSQSPPYRLASVEPTFPPRPAIHEVHSPEFTAQGHGIRQAPVASPSHHEYGPNHASDTGMMSTHVHPPQRTSGYPNVTVMQNQQVRLVPQSTVDTRLQQHGVISPHGYPSRSPHGVISPHGYPPRSPQQGVISPHGYPPRSPQHGVISPPGIPPRSQHNGKSPSGYLPDTPVTAHTTGVQYVYPGNSIHPAQNPSYRQSSMISQQPGQQPQMTGPSYPSVSYPTQVHQLLQKQPVPHQSLTNRSEPNPPMYPQMVPGSRNPHMIPKGEQATHASSHIHHQMAPRGFVAHDHPREMSKGQSYPAPIRSQHSSVNRGSTQIIMSGDRGPQMAARDDPGLVVIHGQNPVLTNVDLAARSNQQSVGAYHTQGNHSAAPSRVGDDQVRGQHLTEEQRLQSMQRIRAQHIRTQQLQIRGPSNSVPTTRYPDPGSMQLATGGNSQANSFVSPGSQCTVQQTNTSVPILDSTSPTVVRSGPSTDTMLNPKIDLQGQQRSMAAANHVRGQGQVTHYAQVNNDPVLISGSHVVQNPQNSYPMQEVHAKPPAGQMIKVNHSPGNSVHSQVSPGNQIRGQVILSPQGQGQIVQFNNTNNSSIHPTGNLVQVDPQSGYSRHSNVDMSRQDHVGGNQGQETIGFQPKHPHQSAQPRNVNVTHNRPILPKPISYGNCYVQNTASQSTVTMSTDLKVPQQTQSAPSSEHSPRASSSGTQLSPQSAKNSPQGQSEGQLDGELPHLQQVHGACYMCGKYSLYLCSNCKEIWYCSPECQLTHWQTHAAECMGPSV